MNSIDTLDNKDSELTKKSHNFEVFENQPIKKCHYLEGKYFIVIHESVADKLNLSADNSYFYQEVTSEGILILRPLKRK